MNFHVLYSVFKRNFVGYLSSPTGYVFICVFVLLGSIAAFLPNEFFTANLANLDQLNIWFPLIMLIFVPAITMGVWAEERRQGTDELLLTIPASDFDIVLGKFTAALSIYTVSLLFSLVCNLAILRYLGTPDIGLFLCTYIGYWLVGLAMISVGMVASFLTGNLTVAYILGALFCCPLIVLQWAEIAPLPGEWAKQLKEFGLSSQFAPFGHGIITFSSIFYFLMITSVMLYLCMVLIGRRHWTANQAMVGTFHYSVRTLSLLVIGLSLCFFFRLHDMRADMTAEKLSTLSPETIKLLKELKPEYPVVINAFLSDNVPESHIQTRLDIESILREIQSICGTNVSVRINNNIKPNTKEALIANERYEVGPQEVAYFSQGTREVKQIFLGVSMRSGLRSLTLPFLDRGLSVEYELVHALCNVTLPERKRIGVLKTDASLFGKMDMSSFRMVPAWQIVEELRKQYIVVEVDPAEPIQERFDALLAVQPSAMGPQETTHFIDAVKAGQPTVIFEDPLPVYTQGISGTSEPRAPAGQMMMMMGRNTPKGDISPLWDLLGVRIGGERTDGDQVVWQEYSPIRKLAQIPKGFVFLDRSMEVKGGGKQESVPFNLSDPVTASMQYMMLPFPGRIVQDNLPGPEGTRREIVSILKTFQHPAGLVGIREVMRGSLDRLGMIYEEPLDLAVRIRGELPPMPAAPETDSENKEPVKPEPVKIDVLLVADIDLLSDGLFRLRSMGNEPGSGINLNFDNVTFVLNAIDSVAGDERFLSIRTRRNKHRTLSKFDENTEEIRSAAYEKRDKLQKDFEATVDTEEKNLQSQMETLEKELKTNSVGEDEALRKLAAAMAAAQKRLNSEKEKKQRELQANLTQTVTELNENIQRIQGKYKAAAVILPPVIPLLIGLAVFFVRRIRETEGIPQSRRRNSLSNK